jgi:hypothetical protein
MSDDRAGSEADIELLMACLPTLDDIARAFGKRKPGRPKKQASDPKGPYRRRSIPGDQNSPNFRRAKWSRPP